MQFEIVGKQLFWLMLTLPNTDLKKNLILQ